MEYVVTFIFGVMTGVGLFGGLMKIGMTAMMKEGRLFFRHHGGEWIPSDPGDRK